ncbi:hypothetical protein LPJ72_003884 [Coemansia sp. Benny D160-2]|nr:hypothetical protein LPJ72_003884 [Coemansia sp. Benny D160-2]
MRCSFALTTLAALASSALARVYFEETFSSPESIDNFKPSKVRDDIGSIKVSNGKWYGSEEHAAGLQLVDDARFYAYAAKLKRPFNSKGKDFIVQFTVKYEQDIDCGGAYLKLLPPTLEPEKFDGDSEYEIMFGPDICGSTNRRVHAIINYNNTNNQIEKVIQPRGDQLSHQYTFWIKADKTFEIRIDNKVQEEGKIEDFWKVLPDKQVPDPDAKKPEDWVDGPAMIEDPEDKKPEDWVDGPATLPDPDAKKPEDWDDDMDGDWEAPVIANPDYKGEWKPRSIKNPEYKGEWTAPLVDNPDYDEDEDLAVFNVGYVGLDIWTVKAGTIFSNILITDDFDYASQFGNTTWAENVEGEIAAKKAIDDEEAKKLEEERKAKEAEKEEEKENDKDKADELEGDDEVVEKRDADDELEDKPADEEDKPVKEEDIEGAAEEDTEADLVEDVKEEAEEKEEAQEADEKDEEEEKIAAKKARDEEKAAKRAAAKEAAEKAKQAAKEAAEAARKAEEAAAEAEKEDEKYDAHDEL